MSQSGTYNSSGGGGGGTVITVQGNTGGKVGPDGTGNINFLGTGNITVGGNPGVNTEFISITGVIPVVHGGTNASSFSVTDGTVYFDGTRLVTTATGTSGQVLTSGGAGVAPSYQNASSGGITTIDGDTGSVTGSTVSFTGLTTAGASVSFSGSGTAMDLNTTDANGNIFIGFGCGNTTLTGDFNDALGDGAAPALTTGSSNQFFGNDAGFSLVDGTGNVLIGGGAAFSLISGSNNIAIGDNVAGNYGGAESNNIILSNQGVASESGVIRIGTNGTQTSTFITGIDGVNVGSVATVVTESGDQLGTAVLTAGSNITITPGANTITIAATGSSPAANNSFEAILTSSTGNITGDGTQATVIFDTAIANNGGGYNTGTGIFTAPVTGLYFFNCSVEYQGLTGANTNQVISIQTTARQFIWQSNPYVNAVIGSYLSLGLSCIASMTIGDTANVYVQVDNGALTVSAFSNGTNDPRSWFGGYQIA